MFRLAGAAAASLIMAGCAGQVSEFSSVLGDNVFVVDEEVFEVARRSAGSNRFGWDYWCGAADYARRVKGADWEDLVYVYRGLAKGQGDVRVETVQFTLEESRLSQPPSVMTREELGAFKVGHFVTVTDGNKLCDQWQLQ